MCLTRFHPQRPITSKQGFQTKRSLLAGHCFSFFFFFFLLTCHPARWWSVCVWLGWAWWTRPSSLLRVKSKLCTVWILSHVIGLLRSGPTDKPPPLLLRPQSGLDFPIWASLMDGWHYFYQCNIISLCGLRLRGVCELRWLKIQPCNISRRTCAIYQVKLEVKDHLVVLNMHDLLGIDRTQASIASETSRGRQLVEPTVAVIYH